MIESSTRFSPGAPKEAFRYDFGTQTYHYYEFHVDEGTFSGAVYETDVKGGTWIPVLKFKDLTTHIKIGLNGYRYSKFVGESPVGGVLRQKIEKENNAAFTK